MEDTTRHEEGSKPMPPLEGAVTPAQKPFNLNLEKARRTAFVARFIVLREAKRTKAHRIIEQMEWDEATTAEELYQRFRQAYLDNKDNIMPVDRDLNRALRHSDPSHMVGHFVTEYGSRATNNFIDALYDYGRSNHLLFGDTTEPKSGGWRLPEELERERNERRLEAAPKQA